MSLSPASIIYDSTGTNPVGVVIDDTIHRLQVETSFKPGVVLQVSDGNASEDPAAEIKKRLLNGSSDDMSIDGSTPVEFSFNADSSNDIKLSSLRIIMVATAIKIGSGDFGPLSSLTNGIKVEVRSKNITSEIALIKNTVDFLDFHGPSTQPFDRSGSNDLMIVQHAFGGSTLVAGSGDFVKITIQDDLSSSQIRVFFGSVAGVKI